MNQYRFKISAGNLVKVTDTLKDNTGAVLDLTGCTVLFLFQGPGVNFQGSAVVASDPTTGVVTYTFAAGQTDVVGDYVAQWEVNNATAGTSVAAPQCPFQFQILPGVPITLPTIFTKLSDFVDDIRAVVGDFKKQVYEDSAIISVMRTQLRLGKIREYPHGHSEGHPTVWGLNADGMTLNPAITNTDIVAYGLLVYRTAHTLILPNQQAYAYRTRAMSEKFGEARDFLFELQDVLYGLENGSGVYANISGLRNWLFAINGIWVWSYLQAEVNVDLSFH